MTLFQLCYIFLMYIPQYVFITYIKCININFSYLFYCQELGSITPKIDATAQTQHSCKQKWHPTIFIPTMYCNVTPDIRTGEVHSTTFDPELPQLLMLNWKCKIYIDVWSGGSIQQLLILTPEMYSEKFSNQEHPFHNFWSWTEKCQIYIHISYGLSCNITCITAISNLHFQKKI